MKISKRHPSAEFGAADESVASHEDFADLREPAPDWGFRPLDAPDPRLAAAPPPRYRGGDVATARTAQTPAAPLADLPEASGAALEPAPSGAVVYLLATVAFVLWACAPIAFALGARSGIAPFNDNGFALAVFALLVIGPGAMIFIAAYLIRQGQKLAAEAKRSRQLADSLVSPALLAAGKASDVVRAMRTEITQAGAAADDARETLLALRDALAAEADHLTETTAASTRNAQGLVEALGKERTEMGAMSQALDTQAMKVADTITQQARMVAEASDLAETQLREAEALLAARAADLAAAAGEANNAARTAGEDLTRHIARLETAGVGVAQQINAVEMGLSEQRAALFSVAEALKSDHEGFASEAETHSAQLAEFISQARLSAVEMGDRAVKGGEALRELLTSARDQMRELAETTRTEREAYGEAARGALGSVSQAATREQAQLEAQTRSAIDALARAAEETRNAAAQQAETARLQVDQLSEAAFSAGQKANQVFEARLAEARELIDHSAKMVEQAGAETAKKLEEGAAAARATLVELQDMMSAIQVKAAEMPLAARGQAEQVRVAVSDSMEELMDQARRAAEETAAIDAAFQSRVRRNYEMLSEAVRLMGSAAGSTPPLLADAEYLERKPKTRAERALAKAPEPELPPEAAPALVEPPAPAEPVVAEAPPVEPEPMIEAAAEPISVDPPIAEAEPVQATAEPEPGPAIDDLLEPPAAEAPLVFRSISAKAEATGKSLRPRLRLTPTATDEEFSSVFGAAQARSGGDERSEEGGWTWKELLTSIDEAEVEAGNLDGRMVDEIAGLGIDPAALLPKGRIEEIAATIQAGDAVGARQVVRKLAPAATRRIARRLSGDARLKEQVDIYIEQYETLLGETGRQDKTGRMSEAVLATDAGRAYLLMDAALSD